jgi:von Willebrand factor type A domain
MSRLFCFASSLGLTLAWTLAPASAPSALAQSVGERRTVVVGVLTTKGQLVNGLDSSNFRAQLSGREVSIVSANYDTSPHRVVVLLDWSGSMFGKRTIETMLADNFVAKLNPASPMAIRTFSSTYMDSSPLSTDRAAAHAKLESLGTATAGYEPPQGKTPLLDALEDARALLNPTQPGDAICIISDGGDNRSKERLSIAREALAASGIRIFALLVYATLPGPPENIMGPDLLGVLSKVSGGRMVIFNVDNMYWLDPKWSDKNLEKAQRIRDAFLAPIEIIAREINGCYRLEIQLPEKIKKPRKWKLRLVKRATGKPDYNLVLEYPPRLHPAAADGA